jgi:hypothetical protein
MWGRPQTSRLCTAILRARQDHARLSAYHQQLTPTPGLLAQAKPLSRFRAFGDFGKRLFVVMALRNQLTIAKNKLFRIFNSHLHTTVIFNRSRSPAKLSQNPRKV